MHGPEQNLVKMANQIAGFFASQHDRDPEAAALALVGHLKLFWAPAMRLSLIDQQRTPAGDAMLPMVRHALHAHGERLVGTGPAVNASADEAFPAGGGGGGRRTPGAGLR